MTSADTIWDGVHGTSAASCALPPPPRDLDAPPPSPAAFSACNRPLRACLCPLNPPDSFARTLTLPVNNPTPAYRPRIRSSQQLRGCPGCSWRSRCCLEPAPWWISSASSSATSTTTSKISCRACRGASGKAGAGREDGRTVGGKGAEGGLGRRRGAWVGARQRVLECWRSVARLAPAIACGLPCPGPSSPIPHPSSLELHVLGTWPLTVSPFRTFLPLHPCVRVRECVRARKRAPIHRIFSGGSALS